MHKSYYTYIMSNRNDTTLYVGVTNDLKRRVSEHRVSDSRTFTGRYLCHKLVYFETYSSIDEAIYREKQIKSWRRIKKDRMIDNVTPRRRDLMDDGYEDGHGPFRTSP